MLMPLAILINTPPSASQTSFHSWDVPAPQTASPVFTRRDNVGEQYSDWQIAKMWVRVADVHYHILGSLITDRLLTETVSLAVYRCLPSVHPVSYMRHAVTGRLRHLQPNRGPSKKGSPQASEYRTPAQHFLACRND